MMGIAKRCLCALVVVMASWMTPAYAFVPQNGLWVITSEQNGQPGRGFDIDIQSNVLVIAYFGYGSSGAALFYLGSGVLSNNQVQTALQTYTGGTYLGGPTRNAVAGTPAGTATLSFTSPTSGSITLPGEATKAITRGTFADISAALNGTFTGVASENLPLVFQSDASSFAFSLSAGAFSLQRNGNYYPSCSYTGTYTQTGNAIDAGGSYICSDGSAGSFTASQLMVDANGVYSGQLTRTPNDGTAAITETHAGIQPTTQIPILAP